MSWVCPHNKKEMCERLKKKCVPLQKGCVLSDAYRVIGDNDEKPIKRKT